MRILVTGVGRSGTAYMAKLLTAAGLSCGHEHLYHGKTTASPSWGGTIAESSWFAVPWLYEVVEDVAVVHLVRNPMKWLASWAFTVWPPARRQGRTARYLAQHTGTSWVKEANRDAIDAAMRLWVTWNQLVGPDIPRLRVEDVDELALGTMLHCAGVSTDGALAALCSVPKHVNAREHPSLAWGDCKHKPAAAKFAELANLYGYNPEVAI